MWNNHPTYDYGEATVPFASFCYVFEVPSCSNMHMQPLYIYIYTHAYLHHQFTATPLHLSWGGFWVFPILMIGQELLQTNLWGIRLTSHCSHAWILQGWSLIKCKRFAFVGSPDPAGWMQELLQVFGAAHYKWATWGFCEVFVHSGAILEVIEVIVQGAPKGSMNIMYNVIFRF